MDNITHKGKVKFYNLDKKYGFITDNVSHTDHFFHFTGIAEKGSIQKDDNVQYELENTNRGIKAINIRKI